MVSIATSLEDRLTLSDGRSIPMFGLGMSKTRDAETVVYEAIKLGYRLIDTAQRYGNEHEVGHAVRRSDVSREDLFVVSKLWENGADACRAHFHETCQRLNIGYVDLYLIHSPADGLNVETYRTMIELQKQGKIRSIGVSNFHVHHLQGMEKAGLPLPTVNQIEVHPWKQNREITRYCLQKGITVMGYSPLAKGVHMRNTQLLDIANRLKKTPGQVLIRWSVQQGYITIPKTSTLPRLVENVDVFDWSIPEEDMAILVPATVMMFGVSGMTANNPSQVELEKLRQFSPDYIFVTLGGNDITSCSSPRDIAGKLKGLMDQFKRQGAKAVYFTDIVTRGKFRDQRLTKRSFDKQRQRINELVGQKYGRVRVPVTIKRDYIDDQIHLNDKGNEKYFYAVRRVVFSLK